MKKPRRGEMIDPFLLTDAFLEINLLFLYVTPLGLLGWAFVWTTILAPLRGY
ncbi:MAG: hypothetical protein IPL46_17060 [Saprospiraceae bacterium]|nr:hypothetical protein [Saprospiraceae bacterium]